MLCQCLCVGLCCVALCAFALQRAGGVGLNASTSHDATKYYVSLPQNKLEVRKATCCPRTRCNSLLFAGCAIIRRVWLPSLRIWCLQLWFAMEAERFQVSTTRLHLQFNGKNGDVSLHNLQFSKRYAFTSWCCGILVQAPVFRELYSEKRVVAEERRLRVDDSPMGSFQVTPFISNLPFQRAAAAVLLCTIDCRARCASALQACLWLSRRPPSR